MMRTWIRSFPTATLLLLFSGQLCWGQTAPAELSLTLGAGYDQGDFGSTETSHATYLPFSIRYTATQFDVSVSSAWAHLDAPDGIILIDGVPTRTQSSGTGGRSSGAGDTFIRTRLHLRPSVSPYLRLKIPTADETRGLGTGKTDFGFGLDLDKDFGEVFVFGDVAYTFVGKVPRLGLRNRPSASIGASRQISTAVTLSGVLDWRRAIVAGTEDPAEFVGYLSYKASPAVTFTPNAFVGLTNGSSDFGVGVEMRVKFGKF
jgi:hypothetical protein